MKTFAYIDGYNLYNGIINKGNHLPFVDTARPFKQFLWLNVDTLIKLFLPPGFELERIKYFTSPERGNPGSAQRQATFLKAIETIPNLTYYLGRFAKYDPPRYPFGIKIIRKILGDIKPKYVEKKTDVFLAVHALRDAMAVKDLKSIVLISGDADFEPCITMIKEVRPDLLVRVIFPPARVSKDLMSVADVTHKIGYRALQAAQFPITVNGLDGSTIQKPTEWT